MSTLHSFTVGAPHPGGTGSSGNEVPSVIEIRSIRITGHGTSQYSERVNVLCGVSPFGFHYRRMVHKC